MDDPTATVQFDWTPAGFHALILSATDTVFIDPYSRNGTVNYISYYKRDYQRPAVQAAAVASAFLCPPEDQLGFPLGESNTATDPIFCSYPAVEGEDPFDFYCTYSATTGVLVEDHDAGLCPANAIPGPPTVVMSSAAPDPTNTSPIPVTAQFSENVTDFTAGDIVPGNATVGNFVAVDGDTYTFELTPSAQGAVTADILAGVAQDADGNPNTAAAQFSRTYDTVAPSVTINQAGSQTDPTSSSPINFVVVFSEPVTGFGNSPSDVTLSGTAGATTAVVTQIAPNNGTTYNVAVSGMTASGTVIAAIPANAAQDAATNGNSASTSTDNTVTFNSTTSNPILVSSNENGSVPGVSYRDEDIIAYNPATQQWSMLFDGSNVGLGNTDIDDFVLLPGNIILLSVETDFTLAGFGPVGDEDVLKFTATSLGLNNTAGSFSMYFDGSQFGLEPGNNSEDIKAVDLDPSGKLVVNGHGPFNALGGKGENEDLFTFTSSPSPAWAMRFDGTDIKLKPDLRALWIDPFTNHLYLAVDGKFKVTGSNGTLSGDGNDIFICQQTSIGANTVCLVSLFRDMGTAGMGSRKIDGLFIGQLPSLLSPGVQASGTLQDGIVEVPGDDADEPLLPDSDESGDEDDEAAQPNRSFLPLITSDTQ